MKKMHLGAYGGRGQCGVKTELATFDRRLVTCKSCAKMQFPPQVHYAVGDRTACGRTSDVSDSRAEYVTCSKCRKTKVFEAKRIDPPKVLPVHMFPLESFDDELATALTNACRMLGVQTVRLLVERHLDDAMSGGFVPALTNESEEIAGALSS